MQVGLVREGCPDLVATVAINDVDARRIQRACRGNHLRKHWLPRNGLQYLGPRRAHALAFAGGKDDDVQCLHGSLRLRTRLI